MEKIKFWKQEIKFYFILNILIGVFITSASYVYLPFASGKDVLAYFVHFVLLHFSLFGFIYLFSLFHKVFKFLFPILFIIATSFSFWVFTQDLSIGTGMIQAIIETNLDIATDVLSYQFCLFVSFAAFSILFFFKRYFQYMQSSVRSPFFYLALLGIITFFIVENYKFDAFKKRLPYSIYFGAIEYFKKPSIQLKEVNELVFTKEENLHIVLVLGESVRADHLSLNGYNRLTNPLLSAQGNLISFNNVFTPFTFTAQSVPQILTDISIDDSSKSKGATSLFTLLNKASFQTEWIGNQSLEKSYKDIIYSNTLIHIIDKFHTFSSFKKQKDAELLKHFSIDNLNFGNTITTFHMIGSHWYYNNRIEKKFEVFNPITTSKYLGSLEAEALINSYDNTIVYLDYFLNTLIEKLKKSPKKTLLIYISDHGETLGEDGKWLHAQEHIASKNPAMLVWFSAKFERNYPSEVLRLKEKKQDSITTDFLFNSILDIGKIENYKFLKSQSIFN